MALPTILRDLTLEDLSALLSQIAALRPEPWQALLSLQVHTVRWPTEPATIPLVVLSSHEGQGPRKRICLKKLKAGWGERNGKSPQRPTSPGEDGHRDRALARKARGVQMAGQTQESEGIYTRQVLPAHLRVPVEFNPFSPPQSSPQVLPVPSHLGRDSCPRPLPQLRAQHPEDPCQVLSPLLPLLCSVPQSGSCLQPHLQAVPDAPPCPTQCFLQL